MTYWSSKISDVRLSRRRFVQGLAASGALLSLSSYHRPAWGEANSSNQPSSLRGTEFDLNIHPITVNYTGLTRAATAINGQIPAPTLYWKEGDTVTLRVTNNLPDISSIHWHGILVPFQMDGVPGLSFNGISPGETFVYRFPVRQSGTYWYHSHSRFQEQTGMYGALVIEPKDGERFPTDREHVVVLSDWTDENPERIFDKLKKISDYYNFNELTAVDFMRDVSTIGLATALQKRKMWNEMRMSPTDFIDITGYTYTYLVNGSSPLDNWTGLFKRGEKVRLRFINASANSIFDVRIPGLNMTVISADGQDVEPVSVDEFRISGAETYDVIVQPRDYRAYTIFAQSIARMGYARATLSPAPGMQAEVPPMDEPGWLSMKDMMGAMAMDGGMGSMQHTQGMQNTAGMKQSSMQHTDHEKHLKDGMSSGMQHGEMQHDDMKMVKAHHARTEYGPSVDMRVDMPRTNLDDPGVNLRDNGRRVLTYADLHTIGGPLDAREAEREMEVHLTGNMERFIWGFDGLKFSESQPLHFRYREKLRVILHNDTMMNHPIHLHGMFSEMESPEGQFQVRKHTINVQPAQRISFLVDADELGDWAFHCHLLYHMEAGMFRKVVVS